MKTLLVGSMAAALSMAAFAQGRVTFGHDSNHLFVLPDLPGAESASGQIITASLAGQPVPQAGTAGLNLGMFSGILMGGANASV